MVWPCGPNLPLSPYTVITRLCMTPQDKMVPFDQLGIEYSPAYFFNASTASYAPSDV